MIDPNPVFVAINAAAFEVVLHVVEDKNPNWILRIKFDSSEQRAFKFFDQRIHSVVKAPNQEKRSNGSLESQHDPQLQQESHVSRVDVVEKKYNRNARQIIKRHMKSEELDDEENVQNIALLKLKDSVLHELLQVLGKSGNRKSDDDLNN